VELMKIFYSKYIYVRVYIYIYYFTYFFVLAHKMFIIFSIILRINKFLTQIYKLKYILITEAIVLKNATFNTNISYKCVSKYYHKKL